MSSPLIKPGKDIIAIHYSRPYRKKINAVKHKVNKVMERDSSIEISVLPLSKNITFGSYLFIRYRNKILRKLTRIS